jgi:hypothetical protein
VQAFVSDRSTKVRIPESISKCMPITTGIPYGSPYIYIPISPILYLLYTADLMRLMDIGSGNRNLATNGCMDDTCFVATWHSESIP